LTFGIRDIDLGRGRIRVERSASKVNTRTVIGTTKTHAARSLAVSASVLKLLAPTTTHWFGAAVTRCQTVDAKFPRVTVHELRHTAASLMIASGANVKTVQAQLGQRRRL
jgi:integrase